VAFSCGQEEAPGAEPAFPPGAAFPASPSKGLSKGLALSKLGHARRASLLCLGAGGLGTGEADPASHLGAFLGPSGQPRERKAPRRPGPPPLQYQTPLNPLQGPSKGSTATSWDFPSPRLPPAPKLLQRLALSPGRLGASWHTPVSSIPPSWGPTGSRPSA